MLMVLLGVSCLAGLCGKESEFQVTVVNQGTKARQCSIRLNEKVELSAVSIDPGASKETRLSLTHIRSRLKELNQSTGALTLNCTGADQATVLELFGYIEPSDNYLAGKEIVAELNDANQNRVTVNPENRLPANPT